MKKLKKALATLHNYIEHAEKSNTLISSVDVGWHIEHSLLVIQKIVETVCKSDPSKYKWEFNFIRTLVFLKKEFPRGKAKAPDAVMPKASDKNDLLDLFSKTAASLQQLEKAGENQFFKHPIFGNLNKKNTYIMLKIHTNHHLNIIKDIVASYS